MKLNTESSSNTLPRINYTIRQNEFYTKCREKADHYFQSNQLSRFATLPMYAKTIILLSLWIGLYLLIISNWFMGWQLILLQVGWHANMFLMSIGIAHDGTHHAYSRRRWINQACAGVFDYIGINSDMWEYNHIRSHHHAPNVPIYDSAIFSLPLFRFHPSAPYKKFHRYQHIYIFGLYAISTLFKLFVLDFISFARTQIGFERVKSRTWKHFLYLLFTKIVVVGYTLVIPLLVLDAPVWQIITGFLVGHIVSGLALGLIFQVTHLHQYTKWPEPDENGRIDNSFPRHILETTSDFCPGSKIITWISGGLNIHVAHHLFPTVSQMHLRQLARIVKHTADEYNEKYYSYQSLWQAWKSHVICLKKLGRMNA